MASSVRAMPSTRMSEAEWQTRVDLAACYRLVDLFGWPDLINTRITARVPGSFLPMLLTSYLPLLVWHDGLGGSSDGPR